ncbi:increased DNA methylation 3-like [Actinidia eriantha]|uniref:increased DNA methylation 3-like n=1 Tax=Actinidia eriantha TaxID=165200 RepID=UPI002590137A|nr:increased DNA methylation 3-like [Actinidia eriantha]
MENQDKPVVVLTGTAKEGKAGLPLGTVDIGRSKNAYLFRVGLPGVRRNARDLKCDIHADGRVHIEGVVGDARIVKDKSAYDMKVKQLCPSGPFTVTFDLPGPVDPRLSFFNFRGDGILEVVVLSKSP